MKKIFLLLMAVCVLLPLQAQRKLKLNLKRTIELANDSSLQAFIAQNRYLSSYWEFRSFKAERLPSLNLNLTPASYYRYITTRYDSNLDRDVYRSQQTFSAGGGFSLSQNFDPLGGSFYLESDLDYMRAFGVNKATTQFSATPIRLGYSQSLLGFNQFKWDKKIEPLKYEKAKKQFLYNTEETSEQAVTYFFNLALAQANYRLACDNQRSTDTLYSIGQMRHKIAAISQADLLTLRLDKINAENTLKNATIAVKRAMQSLAVFLNLEKNTEIEIELPAITGMIDISAEDALALAQANNPTYLEQQQQILEGEQNVNRTKVQSRFNASLSASVGLNQVADKFNNVYKSPLSQELVSMTVSIPLLDWGVRKGKYNMARNNLEKARIQARQEEVSLEEDLLTTLSDFDVQQNLLSSAQEAVDLAEQAYEQTRQRFIIGKVDVNSLTLAQNRQQEAQQNYIQAQLNYWADYYKIRKLTLIDFESGISLSDKLDFSFGYYNR